MRQARRAVHSSLHVHICTHKTHVFKIFKNIFKNCIYFVVGKGWARGGHMPRGVLEVRRKLGGSGFPLLWAQGSNFQNGKPLTQPP